MSADAFAGRSREAVDSILRDLRERHGDFPVVETTNLDDPERFERGIDRFQSGFRGAGGARVTDGAGRVLLIREASAPERWILPGGGNESDESLDATAVREVREETGVECELTGVWCALRKRFVCRDDPERRGYLLEVMFEAEQTGGTAGLYPERWDGTSGTDEQILAVEWFDKIPDTAEPAATDPRGWTENPP
jgi:ADP-ribose pyrophosphatase YjhB (NUDIX family)